MPAVPAIDRLLARVVAGPNGCWIWTGPPLTGKNRWQKPYSVLRSNGKKQMGHRVSYEHFVGAIPDGMEIDHLCKQTLCVNPQHLEAVTHAENVARGYWGDRSHCKNGHEFTARNTSYRAGRRGRICRRCAVLTTTAYQKKQRIAKGGA